MCLEDLGLHGYKAKDVLPGRRPGVLGHLSSPVQDAWDVMAPGAGRWPVGHRTCPGAESLCADDMIEEAKVTKETQSPGTPSLYEVCGLERCLQLALSEGMSPGAGQPPLAQSSGMVGRGW